MPKPAAPKITDFETTFDAVPVAAGDGEVIWADVRIDYLLAGPHSKRCDPCASAVERSRFCRGAKRKGITVCSRTN
jgi:hypothetical protein